MNRIISFLLILTLLFSAFSVYALASADEGEEDRESVTDVDGIEIDARAAVLMDAKTGTVLYTKNAAEPLPPASVTKIMTLLLVAEAIERGQISIDHRVRVSANAAGMGGSQVYIKEGEEFSVDDLLRCTVIASANDAAVALAELVSGSESIFVNQMNKRARELGMNNTCFENCTGLDDSVSNHVTSAYDIALMSRELMKHDVVMKYASVWQGSIRNGDFVLTNTNRLVRYYDGCTGLKTGSTDKAGFCVSATAERDGMHLIAVVMGADTRDARNEAARTLLDYGFSSYALFSDPARALENIPILRGVKDYAPIYSQGFYKLVERTDKGRVEIVYDIPSNVNAPIVKGSLIGKISYKLGDEVIGECGIYIDEDIGEITVAKLFTRILKAILIGER